MTTPSTRRIPTDRTWTAGALAAALSKLDPATPLVFGTATTPANAAPTGGTCWCGCGAPTKSKFAVGHDAKFHGLAKKVARGQAAMPTSWHSEAARADFMIWHDREKAEIAKKAIAAPVIHTDSIEVLAVDEIPSEIPTNDAIDAMSDEEAAAAMADMVG